MVSFYRLRIANISTYSWFRCADFPNGSRHLVKNLLKVHWRRKQFILWVIAHGSAVEGDTFAPISLRIMVFGTGPTQAKQTFHPFEVWCYAYLWRRKHWHVYQIPPLGIVEAKYAMCIQIVFTVSRCHMMCHVLRPTTGSPNAKIYLYPLSVRPTSVDL